MTSAASAGQTGPASPSPTRLTKGARTRLAILQAAVEMLDESGADALTVRALGARLGLHGTAIYRHVTSRDDLLAQALDYLMAEVAEQLDLPADPRDRIECVAKAMRALFQRHPGAAAVLVTSSSELGRTSQVEAIVVDALRALGVAESAIATTYQALESHTIGSALFDYAGAPRHLDMRAARYRAIGDRAMTRASASAQRIDATNEAAFLWGLEAMLARLDELTR